MSSSRYDPEETARWEEEPSVRDQPRTLGRPTRDVNGFWQYAVWNERDGTVTEYPDRTQAERRIAPHGPFQRQYTLIRRWMGGWQAVEDPPSG